MSQRLNIDPLLGELVILAGASVRLRNCVQRSALSDLTVSQAISMGSALDLVCMPIPSMGRKSIRELQELLARFAEQPDVVLSNVEALQLVSNSEQELRIVGQVFLSEVERLFSKISLIKTVMKFDVSVRLVNCVEASKLSDVALGNLLVDWKQTVITFLKVKNFGQNSLHELQRMCTELITSYLSLNGFEANDSALICGLIFNDITGTKVEIEQLAQRLASVPEFSFRFLQSGDVLAPEEMADMLLRDLEGRLCDILIRRYGLRGFTPETLEQTAAGYRLTRERIRQLESKALKILTMKGERLRLRESLIRNGLEIWSALVGGNDFLRLDDVSTRLKLIPCVAFLIDVLGISASELLDQISTGWQGGWCRLDVAKASLDGAKAELEPFVTSQSLPRPLPALSCGEPIEIARIVIELGFGLHLYRGYILGKVATTRSQMRIVDLHILMGDGQVPNDAAQLAISLGGVRRVGSVSSRYVAMLMERHPHLFLDADEGQWFSIGNDSSTEVKPQDDLSPIQADHNEELDEDGFTMAAFLTSILQKSGPTKLSHLVSIAADVLPPDRSQSSIGPTLIMNPEKFTRVLPGVYGLRGSVPSPKALFQQRPTYLLNEEQARLYALGRRAGEPWGVFPMWSPAAEALLCNWALQNANEITLESLLSVAAYEKWPVDEVTKNAWKDFAAKRPSTFMLYFKPRSGYVLPQLDRLLAACLVSRANGQFNWMVGNRILKGRINSHMSAGIMALMCSLGALKIEHDGNWQLPHSCGSNLENLILLISRELHDRGVLDWSSPLGKMLLSQAADNAGRCSGWVDRQQLATMLTSSSKTRGNGEAGAYNVVANDIEAELDNLIWTEAEEVSGISFFKEGRSLIGYSALEITSARILSEDEEVWSLEGNFED